MPETLEGEIIRYADKIAYVNHDIDDAVRGGVIRISDLPKDAIEILGKTHSARINMLINDVISESIGKNHIRMSKTVEDAMMKLRKYLFDNVYNIGSSAKTEEGKAEQIVKVLFAHFMENPNEVSAVSGSDSFLEKEKKVVDYIAGMTDRYAVYVYKKLFIPKGWNK